MLYTASAKNFLSFKDTVRVDFTVNGNAPDTYSYFSKGDTRLTKILGCFGTNASGKTNVLKALSFIKWIICDSWDRKIDQPLFEVVPFLLKKETEGMLPSEFVIDFGIEDKRYVYELRVLEGKIVFEKLLLCATTKPFVIFERALNAMNQYDFKFHDKWFNASIKDLLKKTVRTNASVIAAGSRANHRECNEIVKFFDSMRSNVTSTGRTSAERHFGEMLLFLKKNPELRETIEYFLKKYDTGLVGLEIDEPENDEKETGRYKISARGLHEGGKLDFLFESSGTQNIIFLLTQLLPVLNMGGVAVIDELDSNIHPLIFSELVALFNSPSMNLSNAQLIFTAHSPSVLNDLDKQQIIFVEKNEMGASDVWKMSDMGSRETRNDLNYYAKYMSGTYGAIPRL